jgi:dihydroorotase
MKTLIKNAQIVNEGKIEVKDILIQDQRIERIDASISATNAEVIDAEGLHLLPGCIDDQVHFREPGLTHKGNIASESKACAAGGITSFMEMPNTVPNTLTQDLLADKYAIAAKNAAVNYSFYMGVSNDNLQEALKTNKKEVCGMKIFMGSSTGNMLVDNRQTLENIFSNAEVLIATHCEYEPRIKERTEQFKNEYEDSATAALHPIIRDTEACYLSSSAAVELAKKTGAQLHILHISTAKELELFDSKTPLKDKRITAEACIHHLWFSDADYAEKGNFIKWNPAVKAASDREAIRMAVNSNAIDVIATDHAPHTLEEKSKAYFDAPSGGPLVQHALLAALDLYHQGVFSLEKIVEKMAHNPAILFNINARGYIREGYFADLVLVDLAKKHKVEKSNLLYHCGWSPFENHSFQSSIQTTFVNGSIAYQQGKLFPSNGMRLNFNR